MIVYCIRHGESEGNAHNLHQSVETPLSEIGKSQAKLAGYRLKKTPIDVILTSNYVRTVQTAEIINTILQKPLTIEPLLRELKRPTEIENKNEQDPWVMKVKQEINLHRDEPEWHYSDEENFFDLQLRARECMRMLEDCDESNILCVTHGMVLCMIMSVIIFGDELTPSLFEKMYHQFHNRNTGITIFEHDIDGWNLLTWNDHAHLG